VGEYLAGHLEGYLEAYHGSVFGLLVLTSAAAGVLLLALVPTLRRWMHGHD
jgi:dipeptide/tripeptide permease